MSKKALLQRKSELEQRLANIRSDLSTLLDADFSEQAVQLENRDVLLEIQRVTAEELQKVDSQLQTL